MGLIKALQPVEDNSYKFEISFKKPYDSKTECKELFKCFTALKLLFADENIKEFYIDINGEKFNIDRKKYSSFYPELTKTTTTMIRTKSCSDGPEAAKASSN